MNKSLKDVVWIDLDNSPHVPFFCPIINDFVLNGYSVFLTARDCFQTCGLAEYHGLKCKIVGRHYGRNKLLKVYGTILRALKLLPIAYTAKPKIAVCHGSRGMMLAAKALRIPTVLLMDYEFTSALPSWLEPDISLFPEVVLLNGRCLKSEHIKSYPGIKEDVYVPFFKPDGSIKDDLKLGDDKIIVTIRPPATEAHYHNPESEALFAELLEWLGKMDEIKMVILPRNELKQTSWIMERWPGMIASGKIVIPDHVIDGLNMIWHSDFVVSGGGTMNRESAALGVPVYSIFRGKIGAVDRYLELEGRLTLLTSKEDVKSKIKIRKRNKKGFFQNTKSQALDSIMAILYGFIHNNQTSLKRSEKTRQIPGS